MSLAPGTKIGPYEILAPLGAGGMGEVYRARDPRLSRDVAVKVLPSEIAKDPDRLKRFEHEARAAGALNHPNLLTVFDVGSHDGTPYLVSELLEGETLRQALAKGPLPLRKVLDQSAQIARGLGSAHEKGIVHRDLKPDNLFLDRDGRAKILDFGLAKIERPRDPILSSLPTATSPTTPGTVLGTVGYMAPEQVRGEEADARADIFSFGAVLFEMLSGRRAFRGATAVETMNAILKEDPPEISEPSRPLPPALDRIVRRCLDKSPRARFQSAQDLAFALEALSGESTASVPSGVAPPATSTRRGKARTAWLAAAGLALASAIFLAGRRSAERPPPAFERLTFRHGRVGEARFGPDGQTVYYSAEWDAQPSRIFSARAGSLESRPLDLPDAGLLGLSTSGDMALALRPSYSPQLDAARGTLARVAVAGGSPREVLEGVSGADWTPDGTELAVVKEGEKNRLEFPLGSLVLEAGFLTHPRVSPRGDSVAAIDHSKWPRCGVVVVDRKKVERALTGDDYRHCTGLAWSPDGREIWFTGAQAGGLDAIRAVTLDGRERIVHANPGALSLRDISKDGNVLLTRRTVRFSVRGHGPGEKGERDLSWLNDSYAKDLSADGRMLLLGDFHGAPGLHPIFMRATDGSPAVRLGEGLGGRLSPDGKWVATLAKNEAQIVLLPTGAGQPRNLPRGPIETLHDVEWFADGRRVLAHGLTNGPERAVVTFTQDLEGGPPAPILQGYGGQRPSPDGRFVLAQKDDEGPFVLCPVEGGPCPAVLGLEAARDTPLRWSPDGKTLLIARRGELQVTFARVDLRTGRRDTLHSLAPAERAGIFGFGGWTMITPDGRYYAYSYGRSLSDLYLVKGLR